MSKKFKADLYQISGRSSKLGNDLKEVVLEHAEPQSGIIFEGSSNISVENSNDVVIGTLTQFMGPVTIMQQNNLKKSLTKDGKEEIPTISQYIPISYVNLNSASKVPISPIQVWRNNRKCIAYTVGITISVTLIILGLSLSVNLSYQELKTMESTTDGIDTELITSTKSDTLFRNTVKYVLISHSGGRQCNDTDACKFTVQYHQNFHSHSAKYGNPNFGHNFFIGGNGYFYLDQGWNVKNNVSDNNVELCFMGNYTKDSLNPAMISGAKELIQFGIKLGVIPEDYILVAHNQTFANIESPGQNVYAEIKTWPRWKDGLFPDA